MKNLLIVVLLLLAVVGCGTSYLLLRKPQSELAERIVQRFAFKRQKPSRPAVETSDDRKRANSKEAEGPKTVGADWRGLSSGDWYAGERLSARDLRGKVTLVYVWNCREKPSVEMLSRIEEIWSSFKDKPLVVLGSHRGGWNSEIPNVCRKMGLTFPMYEAAAFVREPAVSHYPYFYVVNHGGKVVYRGVSDRSATAALVEALTARLLMQ